MLVHKMISNQKVTSCPHNWLVISSNQNVPDGLLVPLTKNYSDSVWSRQWQHTTTSFNQMKRRDREKKKERKEANFLVEQGHLIINLFLAVLILLLKCGLNLKRADSFESKQVNWITNAQKQKLSTSWTLTLCLRIGY